MLSSATNAPSNRYARTAATLITSVLMAIVPAWAWAVVLCGRAVPWQADRIWISSFAAILLIHAAWWWRHSTQCTLAGRHGGRSRLAVILGASPTLLASAAIVVSIYSSDRLNALIEHPGWRPLIGAGLLLVACVTWSAQEAAVAWLGSERPRAVQAVARALARRAEFAAVLALGLIGALQASALVMPVGDDLGHYTEVADAILLGRAYPVHVVNQQLQGAGMAAAYPALPVFPVLLAVSFGLFGHTLLGAAMPTVLAVGLFPLLLYAATRVITRSRAAAFCFAALLFLLPAYRIHTLGTPEPDTVFVDLLLVAAVCAGKAVRRGQGSGARDQGAAVRGQEVPAPSTQHSALVWWAAFGVSLGLATLTRPEGVPYAGILLLAFFLARWRRREFWVAAGCFILTLLPFAAVYYSVSGSPWPSTFGGSTLSLRNLWTNLAMLSWPAMAWYAQSVGVTTEVLEALLLAGVLAVVAGTVVIWRRGGPVAAVPVAGLANIGAALLVNPLILGAYSPVDALRHLSFGMPFAVVGLASAAAVVARTIARSRAYRAAVVLACTLLVAMLLVFEADGLARPEPYFGGRASLLWTADGVTLADLAAVPVEFPWAGDPRNWEEARVELGRPYEGANLKSANRSEPYAWLTLLAALVGLAYVSASVLLISSRSRP